MTGKHKPPSRVRYEQENPMVGVRITKSLKELLEKEKVESGKSYGVIIKERLVELERLRKICEELRREVERVHNECGRLNDCNAALKRECESLQRDNVKLKKQRDEARNIAERIASQWRKIGGKVVIKWDW